MSKYDLAKIRKQIRERQGGRQKDPNEFRPPQVGNDEVVKMRFYVLPPLMEGDKCSDGVASKTSDLFFLVNGSHWVNSRPYPCPRIHNEENCPMCELAFDLMNDTQDKKERSRLAKQYLPQTRYAVNVHFLNTEVNPEELRSKTVWYNAPKQVFDIFEACICKDEAGDPDDPEAFGVFFDETEAYIFQLKIDKLGEYNSYKTSKFMANVGKTPIAVKKVNGKRTADKDKIEKILNSRHDIYTKFDLPDVDALKKLVDSITSEPDDNAGFDEDETKDEAKDEAPTSSKEAGEELSAEEPVDTSVDKNTTKEQAGDDESDDELAQLLKEIDSN